MPRNRMGWKRADVLRILDVYRAAFDGSHASDAQAFCVDQGIRVPPKGTLLRWMAGDIPEDVDDAPPPPSIHVRGTMTRRFNDYLKLKEDCLILPDLHIPYHNSTWVNRCITAAKALGITSVFLPGDVVDVNWASAWGDSANEGLDDEIKAWRDDVEPALLDAFERIYWVQGNHEFRLARRVDHRANTQTLVSSLFGRTDDRLVISEYHWGEVHGVWVGHPKQSGTTAHKNIARVRNTDAVLGHSHHVHASQTEDGRHVGWQIGWCGDPNKMRYISVQAPHGAQAYVNGAAIIMKLPDTQRPVILPLIDGTLPPEAYLHIQGLG